MREELGSAGQVVAGLSFGNEQLSEHVAGKTGAGVQRGQSEHGDSQSQQRVNHLVAGLAGEGSNHGCNTTGKDGGRRAEQELVAAANVGLGPDNADCNQSDDRQAGLDDHCAVADDLCVLLGIKLLGGGAGTDQGVEAGHSAAGNGDKQCGEQSADGGSPAGECRQGNHCSTGESAADDADNSHDHHTVEQEGAQVVTGLEQHPDRQQRGQHNINGNEDNPCGAAHVDADVQAGNDDGNNTDDAHDGGGADLHVLAVHEEAEDEGDNDEQQRGGCG